jgi:hypothetical protein
MATPAWLNPNQPLPPVLASPCCPPPPFDPNNPNMPLPVEDWAAAGIVPIWESLPVVQLDFPMGPYDDTTGCCNSDYSGPLGTGLWPGESFCPGNGLGGVPPSGGSTFGQTGLAPLQEPRATGGARGIVRQQRDLRRLGERMDESLERQVAQRRAVIREDREMARGRERRRSYRQGDLDEFSERGDDRERGERRDDRDRDDRGER